MGHDVLLTRQDGSKKQFRIYGRPIPHIGDIVTLPIDGHLIKARIGEIRGFTTSRYGRPFRRRWNGEHLKL
jgi:hypothetical protein